MLSTKQREAYECFLKGHNICITGGGGCGKTYLIQYMYKRQSMNKKIQVCALTGCASVLLDECDAQTLHSWAGTGIETNPQVILNKMKSYVKKRWREVDVLIIDEISMLTSELFECLDVIGRKIRNSSDKPFGGIQVILSGDFYQLPPVGINTQFCFESKYWKSYIGYTYHLTKNYRQCNDETYINLLNNIRRGKITKTQYKLLLSRVCNTNISSNIVRLFPRRYQVHSYNEKKQRELVEKEKMVYPIMFYNSEKCITHTSKENWKSKIHSLHSKLLNDYPIEHLELYVGSRVMCIKNLNIKNKLCNGTLGTVEKFILQQPLIRWCHGLTTLCTPTTYSIGTYKIKQYPLILSYALSIHKCQGISLDEAVIDCGNDMFESGQAYVALSRVRSLNGLYLNNFNLNSIKIHKKVADFYNEEEP